MNNDTGLDEFGRLTFPKLAWAVEEYHRGLKQYAEAEWC